MPAPERKTLAQQTAEFLEEAWKTNPNDPWHYVRALGTKFVEFIDFVEQVLIGKVLRNHSERIRVLEQAVGIAQGAPPPQGQQPQVPGQQAQPRMPPAGGGPAGGPPGPGWVRLDANREPMSPQEQAAEEQADMQFHGAIDPTNYVPANSPLAQRAQTGVVNPSGGNGAPPSSPPPAANGSSQPMPPPVPPPAQG